METKYDKLQCTHGKRLVVTKRTRSTKKILYCLLFFSCFGIAVRIPALKLQVGNSEMLKKMLKRSRNIIINDAVCQDLDILVKLYRIHMSL